MSKKKGSMKPDLRGFGLSDDDLRSLGYTVGETSPSTARDPEVPPISQESGASPPVPRSGRRIRAAVWGFMLICAGAGLPHWYLASAAPADLPDTEFSSARAARHLRAIADAPRVTGSPQSNRVRDFLVAELRAIGLEAETQSVTTVGRGEEPGHLLAARVDNVVARLTGSGDDSGEGSTVAVIAPYDGPSTSSAAGRAVGAAAALELAHVLVSREALRGDVLFVFTEGDALGGLGSSAFLDQHAWGAEVTSVVSLEGMGLAGGAHVLGIGDIGLATSQSSLTEMDGPAWGGATSAMAAAGPSIVGSRTWSGRRGVRVTVLGEVSTAGQAFDVTDRVHHGALQEVGTAAVAVVVGLLAAPGSGEEAGPRTRAWIPLAGAFSAPMVVAWSLAGVITLSLLLLLVLAARAGDRRGPLLGVAFAIGLFAISGWIARGVLLGLSAYHPEMGAVAGGVYRDAPHLVGLVALVFAVGVLGYGVLRRWVRLDELILGGLVAPVAFAIWLTLQAPEGGLSVLLPVAFATMAAVLVRTVGRKRPNQWWVTAGAVALTGLALLFSIPLLTAASSMWTLAGATRFAEVAALVFVLCLPAVDRVIRPRPWSGLAFLGMVAAVGLVTPTLLRSSNHPHPSTLVYLADEAEQSALESMIPDSDLGTAQSARRVLGKWLTVPGPGEGWARTWAVDPPAAGEPPGWLLLPRSGSHVVIGSGPTVEMESPRVEVSESLVANGRRFVGLDVRSGLGGEMVALRMEGEPRSIVAIDDVEVPDHAGATSVEIWGTQPGEGVRVTLSLPVEADSFRVTVLEHHHRPQEVLGVQYFERGDSVAPDPTTGTDRVIQRTVLNVGVGSGG